MPPEEPTETSNDSFAWLDPQRFRRVEQAREDFATIWQCGAPADLLNMLRDRLMSQLDQLSDLDAAVSNLSRFISSSRSPTALLALFERDEAALPALLQVFATSQTLANRLIADPESFDLMRASDGQPAQRKYLVDELLGELRGIDSEVRAAVTIRKFTSREIIRIAYGEFVKGLTPNHVGRQLAYVADAVIEAALDFVTRKLVDQLGQPQLVDGSLPQVTVIGLGNLGGEEGSYASPLQLVFLYDKINEKNPSHRSFYEHLVSNVLTLICPEDSGALGFQVDLARGPFRKDSTICSVADARDRLQTRNRTWQRMAFIKARVVAGADEVGKNFLREIEPWVYQKFMSRSDFDDVRALRRKLERRLSDETSLSDETRAAADEELITTDIVNCAGGRRDIERTVQFLQLLHGGDLPDVRLGNTDAAIIALEKSGCLLHEEAELLASNYARLCRLHHQLSIMFGRDTTRLPLDPAFGGQVAWQLGVRTDGGGGDLDRFKEHLADAFALNRKMINHLMIGTPDHGVDSAEDQAGASIETELILDPDPDAALVVKTLSAHRLADPVRAMDDLLALSNESVAFLSPRRCRHFFAAIAPELLKEIATTPFPDQTLQSLVAVADSLGAKATLWELLAVNPATMRLLVRLCSSAPYLSSILTNNPGMIDELIDSLLMNRLPSGDRFDAHSIELCRGALDLDIILRLFKNSAHLMIGVRDILNMESIESTHAALSDTAEACLRRVIDHETEILASRFGDPVDQRGEPSEMVAIALGKFGGREPNYHSDLDVIFLYSALGETKRRVGGRRSTTTNHHFFNQLAQRVVAKVNESGENGRLYELDGRLRPTGDEGTLAVSIEAFLKRFRQGIAPLWQRLALCKARTVSGSRLLRNKTDAELASVIAETKWHNGMADEIREMRQRTEETAAPENLKRGSGGTVDVEVIAQMLTLKHAAEAPEIVHPGTIVSLKALAKAGFLPDEQALQLIHGYRTLRSVEARLRLLDTSARHELPTEDSAIQNLAFLLREPDPAMILAQTQQARISNRKLFDKIFDNAAG